MAVDLFLVIFSLVTTQTLCEDSVTHFSLSPSYFGKTLRTGSKIGTVYDIDIVACARECFTVTACKSFNYNKMTRTCFLKGTNSSEANEADWDEDSRFIFSDVDNWPKKIVGTCADKPCSMKQKCVPSQPYLCKGYCDIPVSVEGASVDDGGQVQGSVRTYKCEGMRIPSSSHTSVTCQATSEWSEVKFRCIDPQCQYIARPGNRERMLIKCQPYSEGMLTVSSFKAIIYCSPHTFVIVISSCEVLRTCNPGYGDGNYLLFVVKLSGLWMVELTCSGMEFQPTERITFPTPSYTEISETGHPTRGVYYYSVGIDVDTAIIMTNTSISNGTGCLSHFASIRSGCYPSNFSMTIDLVETGLKLLANPTWKYSLNDGSVVNTAIHTPLKRYIVTGTIMGSGEVTPDGDLVLEKDIDDVRNRPYNPVPTYTEPVCV